MKAFVVRGLLIGASVLSIALAGACATAGPAADSRTILTTADILESASGPQATVYEVLLRLRPEWLVARQDSPVPRVLVNEIEVGDISTLRTILASRVLEVRRDSSGGTISEPGAAYAGGVIRIVLRR